MSVNPFDIRGAMLATHAQHVVLTHFPIALFPVDVAFDYRPAFRTFHRVGWHPAQVDGVDRDLADAQTVDDPGIPPVEKRTTRRYSGDDVLEAGHCVWEDRAPEFESIVAQWMSGGFGK